MNKETEELINDTLTKSIDLGRKQMKNLVLNVLEIFKEFSLENEDLSEEGKEIEQNTINWIINNVNKL